MSEPTDGEWEAAEDSRLDNMIDDLYENRTRNREARKAFKRLQRKGQSKRVAYMKSLHPELQWRVARLAAGGTLDDK